MIAALAKDPLVAPTAYFHFPAWVEICRRRAEEEIPPDLEGAYFAALAQLPSLVAETYARPWDTEFVPVALAAVAAAKGSPVVAEAALELTPEVAAAMLDRLDELG